jgi:pimeloyl-ACP methyl ester carboxylesterase
MVCSNGAQVQHALRALRDTGGLSKLFHASRKPAMGTVISTDGTIIAYDRAGSGPPLILVDGALCSRSFGPSKKLQRHLADHFTVLRYDRRGRGESSNAPIYGIELEIADLDALIADAGGSAFVLGLSSGAALALHALTRGAAISKLAMYEPPYLASESGSESARGKTDHHLQLTRLIAADRRADAVKYFLRDMVGMPGAAIFVMSLMMPIWSKMTALAHTLPYDAAIMGDFSVPRPLAAAVDVPTLVMAGEKTDARIRKAAQALAQGMPNAQHRVFEGQTHNIDAKAVAAAAAEFFLREPSQGRGQAQAPVEPAVLKAGA